MSEIVTVRDLAMVTSDIQYAQRQGARQLASNLIEIGRLLVEAKTMVEPKNWDKYIWDNFGYSTSSADNWMKLYREYGDNQESLFDSFTNSQTFGKLSYTQLLALTALPAEERSEFVENNDVENMSTRQLQQAIRERDEARKAADAAETELAGVKTALDKARRDAASDAEEINSKLHQAQEARANAEKSESHALDMVSNQKRKKAGAGACYRSSCPWRLLCEASAQSTHRLHPGGSQNHKVRISLFQICMDAAEEQGKTAAGNHRRRAGQLSLVDV